MSDAELIALARSWPDCEPRTGEIIAWLVDALEAARAAHKQSTREAVEDAITATKEGRRWDTTSGESSGWRCYWCNALFTDRAKAEIHFGAAHSGQTAPECFNMLRRERDALTAKLAEMERDARRYRKLKRLPARFDSGNFLGTDEEFDASIDAAAAHDREEGGG